jgi:hypothetical protein
MHWALIEVIGWLRILCLSNLCSWCKRSFLFLRFGEKERARHSLLLPHLRIVSYCRLSYLLHQLRALRLQSQSTPIYSLSLNGLAELRHTADFLSLDHKHPSPLMFHHLTHRSILLSSPLLASISSLSLLLKANSVIPTLQIIHQHVVDINCRCSQGSASSSHTNRVATDILLTSQLYSSLTLYP